MAIIACPECGKDVSEHAVTCPHCGLKLNSITAGILRLKQKAEEIKAEKERDPEAFKARLEARKAASNPNLTAGQGVWVVVLLMLVAGGGAWAYNEYVDKPKMEKLAAERAAEEYKNSPEGKKEARKAEIQKGFGFRGEHKELTALIKNEMDDPQSFELVNCVWFDQGDHVVVIEEFRGRNEYGVMQLYSVKAKCGVGGEVIEVMNVKRMR